MAWPAAPANDQIFTRPDGVQFKFRSATNSWLRLTTGLAATTQTVVTAVGISAVPIPSGAKKVRVRGVGGGGSGGFAGGTNRGSGAPGGGAGWAGEALIDLTGISAISANIGAGGVGTTTTVANGGNTVLTFTGAGSITFGGGVAGSLPNSISGTVPGNGTFSVRGGYGGDGSTTIGGLFVSGGAENGEKGEYNAGINCVMASGAGGSTPFGRGGRSRGSQTGITPPDGYNGEDGIGYGSGGSGACSEANGSGGSSAQKGGNGANGMALFEWIF
jgi:hypothetical protein